MVCYVNPDMCRSALGKKMQCMRAERPDEWTMDEYIHDAEKLQQQKESLEQELINMAHETGMEIAELKGDKHVLRQQNQEMLEMLKENNVLLRENIAFHNQDIETWDKDLLKRNIALITKIEHDSEQEGE